MAANWKTEYHKAFGNHLKQLRTTKKLSQLELSKRSGVSLSHISRIERGARGPTVLTIADLAHGLKLHPKMLLSFEF